MMLLLIEPPHHRKYTKAYVSQWQWNIGNLFFFSVPFGPNTPFAWILPAISKGSDQPAQKCRLIRTYTDCKWHTVVFAKTEFLRMVTNKHHDDHMNIKKDWDDCKSVKGTGTPYIKGLIPVTTLFKSVKLTGVWSFYIYTYEPQVQTEMGYWLGGDGIKVMT